jgi:hypothetical protein
VGRFSPAYGYFPKPSKTKLIVKNHQLFNAEKIFAGSGVEITTEGERHLGAVVGSNAFKSAYINEKIDEWVDNVERLSKIAITQPHAAFAAFTHSLQSRWSFVSRTIPDASVFFKPLEEAIRMKFIPSLLGRGVNDLERKLFSLPARHAGLGIFNPCESSEFSFKCSYELSAPLTSLILKQDRSLDPVEMRENQKEIRNTQKLITENRHEITLNEIKAQAPLSLNLCIKIAVEKSASSWVTARPLHVHSTVLNKGDFRDAIYLRYGWTPPNLPALCGCRVPFSVQHAMECMLGGFRGLLHNEVTHVIHDSMKEAGYKDIALEPQLLPLEGESFKYKSANKEDGARSDISVHSFWSRMRRAYFDTTAF